MTNKVLGTIGIVWRIFAGTAAGYFVYKAIEDKAEELTDNGGDINAFVVGVGHGSLAAAAAVMTSYLVS